jgi:hypothetical protein
MNSVNFATLQGLEEWMEKCVWKILTLRECRVVLFCHRVIWSLERKICLFLPAIEIRFSGLYWSILVSKSAISFNSAGKNSTNEMGLIGGHSWCRCATRGFSAKRSS